MFRIPISLNFEIYELVLSQWDGMDETEDHGHRLCRPPSRLVHHHRSEEVERVESLLLLPEQEADGRCLEQQQHRSHGHSQQLDVNHELFLYHYFTRRISDRCSLYTIFLSFPRYHTIMAGLSVILFDAVAHFKHRRVFKSAQQVEFS